MDEFIFDICDILEIEPPKISYDTSMFPTETTLAMYDRNNNVIHLSEVGGMDMFFAIAHELHHAWQHHVNPDAFDLYFNSDKSSTEIYNLQPMEIDANAFAIIVMADMMGVKPLYKGVSKDVRHATENRIQWISEHEIQAM